MEIATSRTASRLLTLFFVGLVLFLYAPIVVMAIFSFNKGDPTFPLEGFTTDWYARFLDNALLIEALRRSVIVATVSSVIAVALGVVGAFVLLRRHFTGKAAASALVFSPLVVPYLVFGIALLVVFTAVDGFLRQTTGRVIGLGLHVVVIGHVVVSLPYTILTIMPLLEKLSIDLEEAARDLGATPLQTFRRVTLPLLVPALLSAFLIAFTLSFDEYAIASFVAGEAATWPVYLYAQLRVPSQLPQLLAVSTIVLVASIVLVLGAEIGRRLAERRWGADLTAVS